MNNNLKVYLAGFVFVIIVAVILMFAVRQFSLAITTVDVIEVEPGVRCARMVTADGAAISCWEVGNE
jgi:small basic protein